MLKDEEKKKQKEQYNRALNGGQFQINFEEEKFLSLSDKINRGSYKTITGGDVPYEIYSVIVEENGMELGAKELNPKFVVVKRGMRYRLLKLLFI